MAIWTSNSTDLTTSKSYIKYRIRVILESQNVVNNTSNVTVQVQVWHTNTGYTTYGTGTVYVNINGTNYSAGITSNHKFTYNSNTQIFSRNLNISHDADGHKTLNIGAWISHSQFTSSSQSYHPGLDRISKASTLSAFRFASNLKPSTAVNLNYTIDRKSTAFRHRIQLRDGSRVVQTWDNVDSNGASSVQLSTASVNSLLDRMSNVTSRSLTLSVATRSEAYGEWVGSAVTRNATATVDASVKPTVSALTVSQTGNSVTSHFLQAKSKVKASFTRTAVGGATIANSSITVRRKTTNNDVQTINSNDGTTDKTVNLSGTYEAQGMARDSRGRTTYTAWAEFTVTAYTSPRITNFTAVRSSSTPTTVTVTRVGTHTSLGKANSARMLIEKRTGTGAWSTVQNITDASGTWSGSINNTGNSVTSSYEFRATLTDAFGEVATANVTVSTQRVILDIHKNEGVGIGKIHELGVLDVDGDAYFNNTITNGIDELSYNGMTVQNNMGSMYIASGSNVGAITINVGKQNIMFTADISIRSYDFNLDIKVSGYTYVASTGWHSDNAVGTVNRDVTVRFRTSGANGDRYIVVGDTNTNWGGYPQVTVNNVQTGYGVRFNNKFGISLSTSYAGTVQNASFTLRPREVTRGYNGNGEWVRYDDGTQICWSGVVGVYYSSGDKLEVVWTYPVAFSGSVAVFVTKDEEEYNAVIRGSTIGVTNGTTNSTIKFFSAEGSSYPYRISALARTLAIGRWK